MLEFVMVPAQHLAVVIVKPRSTTATADDFVHVQRTCATRAAHHASFVTVQHALAYVRTFTFVGASFR